MISIPAPRIANPRERRLLVALLEGEQSREALDRRIGASNSPDVVMRIRRKGIAIGMRHVNAVDRDGQPCRPGVYTLSAESLDAARAALWEGVE